MKEAEHRKQMLIQQIADHRELMRLEMEVLRDADPVMPMLRSGRELLGTLGAIRSGRSTGSLSSLSQLNLELASTAMPAVLQVLKAVLRRRQEKRSRAKRP